MLWITIGHGSVADSSEHLEFTGKNFGVNIQWGDVNKMNNQDWMWINLDLMPKVSRIQKIWRSRDSDIWQAVHQWFRYSASWFSSHEGVLKKIDFMLLKGGMGEQL